MKSKETKFVIFGQGRSGTTLLRQLLDSHPSIQCDGELLNKADGYITHLLVRKLVYKFPVQSFGFFAKFANSDVYGFTLLYGQIHHSISLLVKLHQKGWKIIYLERRDAFQQSLSHLVARQTSFWHRRTESACIPEKPVQINPGDFENRLLSVMRNKRRIGEGLLNIPHHKLIYEEDLKNKNCWSSACNEIFRFLDVEPESVSTQLKKTYPHPYDEIVGNYGELLKINQKHSKY